MPSTVQNGAFFIPERSHFFKTFLKPALDGTDEGRILQVGRAPAV
jgi:hypothetical protein